MATTTTTLLDQLTLSDGDRLSAAEAPDLGDSHTLEICLTVHQAAEGVSPGLVLMHAPDADDEAWLPFDPPIRLSLARAGKTWVHVDRFTRYVGWQTDGSLESSAVVSLKVVGKA